MSGFVANDGLNKWDYLGKYIGPGYGVLPIPIVGQGSPTSNLSETVGDASVPSVFGHIIKNSQNSAHGLDYNNQAADYLTYMNVLGVSSAAIDDELSSPARSLFQSYSDIKEKVRKGETVDVDHEILWFAASRDMTIGHVGLKLSGEISCQGSTDSYTKWKFKGNVKAMPDKFDFNQMARSGVTDDSSIPMAGLEFLLGVSSGWFYIKFLDELKNVEYEGIIR